MLSPRGQAGKNCPRHVLECHDGAANHCEFAMTIYQSYLLTDLVLLI